MKFFTVNPVMSTPERLDMAVQAVSIQQRAEIETCRFFMQAAALAGLTDEQYRASMEQGPGGFKRAWNRRYRIERRLAAGEAVWK